MGDSAEKLNLDFTCERIYVNFSACQSVIYLYPRRIACLNLRLCEEKNGLLNTEKFYACFCSADKYRNRFDDIHATQIFLLDA